jgi:predicted lipase
LVDAAIQDELAQIGQYTIIVCSILPFEYVFRNLEKMRQKDFPLEGYESLPESVLVSSFRGSVADVSGFLVHLPSKNQLLLSFAGTTNLHQALYDIRASHHPYPARKGCTVHTGFWLLYQSVSTPALNAIRNALAELDAQELVVTGHSMGGALAYLLAMEIMTSVHALPTGMAIKIVVFGAPRIGNSHLQQYFCDVVHDFKTKNGDASVKVYSVKAYNDGNEPHSSLQTRLMSPFRCSSSTPDVLGLLSPQ